MAAGPEGSASAGTASAQTAPRSRGGLEAGSQDMDNGHYYVFSNNTMKNK